MNKISKAEQETIIRFAADEKQVVISTANPTIIRKLDAMVKRYPNEYARQCELTNAHDARYTMPVKRIRFSHAINAHGKAGE